MPPKYLCLRNGEISKEHGERLGDREEKEIVIRKKKLYALCDGKRCTERGIRTDRLRSDDDK